MSKNIKSIIIMIIILIFALIVFSNVVQSASTQVELTEDSQIVDGYYILTLRVSSDKEVGVLEGYIKSGENIESIEVPNSYNGWVITYNSTTGKFNTFNPQGLKEGNVLQIKCKVKDLTKSAKMLLTDVKATTITYDTVDISGSIEKIINLQNDKEDKPSKPDENTSTLKPDTSNNSNTLILDSNTSNNSNISSTSKRRDTSTSTKILPKAGVTIYFVVAIVVLLLCIIINTIIYNKFYKDVK